MVEKTVPVVWNKSASENFKRIYKRIEKNSYSNAVLVRDGISKIVDSLPANPEKYPPDKYRRNNKRKA